MKNITKLFLSTLCFLVFSLFMMSSCNKMNDIQQEYADREEQVYLGKVDSIQFYPGFGRVKLSWYVSSDPKIERTVIYWNMRQDSVVKDFSRNTSGVQKDSVILDNLPEGNILFEFRNVNNRGETSLYSSVTATVWGVEFGDGLRARSLQAFDYNYEQSIYNLTLSPSSEGDDVLFSEIIYINSLGEEKTVEIGREIDDVALTNFADGSEFRFRTVFFPQQGIDTVYNDFQVYHVATVVSERGMKISHNGNMKSKYFDRYGELLYEWNSDGDLIVYTVSADGELKQIGLYPAIVSRNIYRDFFFYDDDKFIGIRANNGVSMVQFDNGKFNQVGAETFGSGFTHSQFLPTRGFFYSRSAAGDIQTWIAQNNASWGTPNGTTVASGYDVFGVVMLYNHEAILAVDKEGYLWSMPVSVSGRLGSKSRIGSGWDRFKKIISVGTALYGMEENGDFYVFNNFDIIDTFWVVN